MNKEKLLNQIKEKIQNLHKDYNMYVDAYDLNGEEDFNSFLDLFKDKEGLK